jgi:hypothetical protein
VSTDASPTEHEASLALFLLPRHRKRFQELLTSTHGREKLRQSLAHLLYLDPRFLTPIRGDSSRPEAIYRMLLARRAPTSCSALSEDPRLDGKQMPLQVALEQVVGKGFGTLLSCIPGRLGFFEGEEAGERYLVERGATPAARR